MMTEVQDVHIARAVQQGPGPGDGSGPSVGQPIYNAHEVAASLLRPGAHLLDAGCGSGRFTRLATKLGCPVTPVDISTEHAATLAADGFPSAAADLEDPNWPEVIQWRQFDQVAALDVLEHLRDPLAALRTLVGLVAPGGQLILSVPNVTHLDVRMELAAGRFRYTDDGLLDRTHLRFFDRPALDALLDSAGLSTAQVIEICRDARGEALAGGADPQLVSSLAAAGDAAVQQWIVHWEQVSNPPGFLRRLLLDSQERAEQLQAAGVYARGLEVQLASQDRAIEELRQSVDQLAQRAAQDADELSARAAALDAGGEYVKSLLDKLAQVEADLSDALHLQREVASQREVIAALSTQAGQYQASFESVEAAYRQLEAHHLQVVADGQAGAQAAQAHVQSLLEQVAALEVEVAAAKDRAVGAQDRAAAAEHELALVRAGLGYQVIQPGTKLLARHPGLARPLRPLARAVLRGTDS